MIGSESARDGPFRGRTCGDSGAQNFICPPFIREIEFDIFWKMLEERKTELQILWESICGMEWRSSVRNCESGKAEAVAPAADGFSR